MPLAILLLILTQRPPGDEVVVTARKRKCEIAVADKIVKDKEFRARAAEWTQGVPVRVVLEKSAGYKCLAKIVFKLNDYGVTRVTFESPAR